MKSNNQIINGKFWAEYSHFYKKFTPVFQKKLLKYVGEESFGNVFDFGFGVGKLFPYLLRNSYVKSINGCEFNKLMFDLANNSISDLNSKIPFNIKNVDILNLQSNNLNIDTAVFINSLYPNSNPIEILKNITRKMKKNSKIIISDMGRTVHFSDLENSLINEFGLSNDLKRYFEMNEVLTNECVPRSYCSEELVSILELLEINILKNRKDFLNSSNTLIGLKRS